MLARLATQADAASIARIYNEAISGVSTLEARSRDEAQVRAWFDGMHPVVVVEEGGAMVGFAASTLYRALEPYAGVAELGVFVLPAVQRRGAGRVALERLMEEARGAGVW